MNPAFNSYQALGGAVHNVDRCRTPVLIYAGAAPFTLDGELKGSRNEFIFWFQGLLGARLSPNSFKNLLYRLLGSTCHCPSVYASDGADKQRKDRRPGRAESIANVTRFFHRLEFPMDSYH